PEQRKKNLDYCVEQLRLADFVGARCAVNVAGSTGPRWDGHYKSNYSPETRRLIIRTVREIIDRADVKNTYFTLEPMPWMVPSGPEDYRMLLEEVDRDRFAVHMDMVNMVNSTERYYIAELFIDKCVALLGKKIRSCHIKDVHMAEEFTLRLEECAPGEGEFPLEYYAKAMAGLDPDMPVILEHLNSDEDYIKYFGVLKERLHGI
ncbi:MAG: sugar phosphate isomerase/epimerase, partial [Lachnospiraceae bacterium]|nr:sugar phosphate isomerase/epimerase [Lachnospiraceae bacterium]